MGAPVGPSAYAAFGGEKKNWGACGAPNGFKNVTRSLGIPIMCLVLKSDNGKVVSIANRLTVESQNHGITEPSSTVLLYRYI